MADKKVVADKINNGEDKQKALKTTIQNLEKTYGKGAVMKLGDNADMKVQHISTGSLNLDYALGIGGLPKGRIIEIFGPESAGKSLIAECAVASVQKNGGTAAYIDVEHALDPSFAEKLGVDIDSLLVSQPDNGEQAMEITEALIRSGAIDIIVVDSVAALVPTAEIEGCMGDAHVGLLARLMSQSLRKLTAAISKTNCICIFINQLREKVGVIYGNPEVTTGGRALKFYSSVRLEVRKSELIKSGSDIIGHKVKVKVVKNKVAPPFKLAEFDIIYDEGISVEGEIVDAALNLEIISRSGAWFYYGDRRLAQGRDNVKLLLKSEIELKNELMKKINEKLY